MRIKKRFQNIGRLLFVGGIALSTAAVGNANLAKADEDIHFVRPC